MKRLEKQLKALHDHLTNLSARADKARGQTRGASSGSSGGRA
jgi:hypothetical protein